MQAKVVQALIDDLQDAGVQDSLIKRIAGHEDGAVTFSAYGSRTPLKAMYNALRQITARGDTETSTLPQGAG